MDSFTDLFEKQQTPLDKMTKDELASELTVYRSLFTWLNDDVKYWLTHIRQEYHIIRRDYKDVHGLLGQPHFKLESIDVDVVERTYKYSKGIAEYETKTVTIPVSQMVDYELSLGKEEVLEQMDGTPISEAVNEANEIAGKELK